MSLSPKVTDLSEPENRLRNFFDEMHEWEVESRKRSKQIERGEIDSSESHQESQNVLSEIFNRFCVANDHAARGLRYQHPPEYNSRTEIIVSLHQLSTDRIEVFTEQTEGWRYRRKFTLHCVFGEWRIASKHRINSEGNAIEESL